MALILWIFLGSGLGGVTRYLLALGITQQTGSSFPWGTLAVNVLGSFLIGFLATTLVTPGEFLESKRHFLITGFLGGFTTYSAFSYQTLVLAKDGKWLWATANASGTFILCFVAVWLGYLCATAMRQQ